MPKHSPGRCRDTHTATHLPIPMVHKTVDCSRSGCLRADCRCSRPVLHAVVVSGCCDKPNLQQHRSQDPRSLVHATSCGGCDREILAMSKRLALILLAHLLFTVQRRTRSLVRHLSAVPDYHKHQADTFTDVSTEFISRGDMWILEFAGLHENLDMPS